MRLSFTAFYRTEYWQQTVQSWALVRGIAQTPITVFLEPSIDEIEMQEIARTSLPNVEVVQHSRLQGVSRNPWLAMEDAFFGGADFAILAEDDIVVSTDILEYFEWAREEFRDDPEVLAVCSFDNHLESPGHVFAESDVVKSRWFSPLVWGTWTDRWSDVLRDSWDFDYSYSGWDWHVRRDILVDRWHCVFPRQSRSTHIGQFRGTHMMPEHFHETQAGTFTPYRPPTDYEVVGYLDFYQGTLHDEPVPYDPPTEPEKDPNPYEAGPI